MKKKYAVLFYIASICLNLVALFSFINNDDTSVGIFWLCLGSIMICYGSGLSNKKDDDK